MPQSTKGRSSSKSPGKSAKPAKPYPDFPLFPHATRRWAKKIRGKLYYFGKWDDPQAAVDLYQFQREDLYADPPRPRRWPDEQEPPSVGLTVRELANKFMSTKRDRRESGEITSRTWNDYYATAERVVNAFGKTRLVKDLRPDDFERLRASIAKTRGPVALGNDIIRVRMLFKYAKEYGLIEKPVLFGPDFRKPSVSTLRKVRNKSQASDGLRMFEAGELRKIIAAADQPMRAMIHLAANCGFGQSDLSSLPKSALDLKGRWVDYPRPKTGTHRRAPLWPETVAAIKEAIAGRPKPKDPGDAGLVFITKYGQRWVKANKSGSPADALGQEFSKLLVELKLKRPGLSFYGLRHTFETIAGGSIDQVAVDAIMGHVDNSMGARYRERIDDQRLKTVVEHVRKWLWPPAAKPKRKKTTSPANEKAAKAR